MISRGKRFCQLALNIELIQFIWKTSVSMSFGFSQLLSEVKGSAQQFAQLNQELLVVHNVLLQVEQLRANNQLAHDALNALVFLTNGITEALENFTLLLKQYEESLQEGGSGNVLKDVFKKREMKI